MADEYFDIVDERDEVVGRASRKETHAKGLWHRAVHVLVFDSAGRICLQRRTLTKDTSPGCWDSSCSGHVDAGEDYDAAARRELGEEIGLRREAPPARWFRVGACAETGWEFVWVYRMVHDGGLVPDPTEVQELAWFLPTEVARLIRERPETFAPSLRLIWSLALATPDFPEAR